MAKLPTRPRAPRSRIAALAVLAATLGYGCSEKPAGNLVWKQDLIGIKTALSAVVAFSPQEAIAVGQALPEFALQARPLSLRWTASGWTEIAMPWTRSTALLASALDRDGSVWAVGRIVSSEAEPFDPVPVAYRYTAGTWSLLPLDELGPQAGVAFTGVATSGSGPDLEARAVGDSVGQVGRIFRWAGGHWSPMTTPDPSPGANWTLRSISYSAASRTWYAVGAGPIGGTILVDRGAGWELAAGPATTIEWTSVAFDGRGIPYLAGNRLAGGNAQGDLYLRHLGQWAQVPIARHTAGGFHLQALGFDAEGNGWTVGGREAGGPFFAGTSPKGWVETVVEAEVEAHPEQEQVAGGDLSGVAVYGASVAFTVGSALEVDPEGGQEFQPRIFRLKFRPAGEVDLPTAPPH
ncbi:MAG: hypothetical protein E6K72_12990 [Candidatus Eisenbacteria bacterium]|uniref:Uncharacterized protein n=1 Tax=Eiseniibacteriota bacterium TaxID=2212470 RepID=A0A538SAZ7_UNCEI|nr:MAG: hypothetical protein E6K72_12990 [Candidatus Eisenbacteria bacterium]